MNASTRSSQSGFSLVELLVAMLVTLVVSGAVFALMTAGQGAFRREPELTERQQNIRVASWYIGGLWHKFKGQVPLAAAAYNAGPHNMMKWLDAFGDRPMDEFVEHITHAQARGYARRVAGIYARYLYLYEGTVYEQPLTLDRAYVKNELNY